MNLCAVHGLETNMEFDHSFEVPLPPAEAWTVLMDIERIAPCMPGAELTEVTDPQTYKGKVSVRLGPVALVFAGVVKFEDVDATSHKARVKAQGSDSKGRGGANAIVDFRVEPAAAGSIVRVHTNLQLSARSPNTAVGRRDRGHCRAADRQFANNLKTRIATSGPPPVAAGTPAASRSSPAKPIAGFALMMKVLWRTLTRLFTGRAGS